MAQLKTGSIAQKSDVLEVGDILLGVNGIKTAGLKHEQVIDLIKQVDDQLTLDIEYELPQWRMLFILHPPIASLSFAFKHNYFFSRSCHQFSAHENDSNSIGKRRTKLWFYFTWWSFG